MHAPGTPVDTRGLSDIPVQPKNRSYINGKLYYYIRSRLNDKAISILNEVLTEDSFKTLLHYAAKYDNYEVARKLIELGADVNHAGQGGQTPLMFALKNRGVETAKILLDAGAKIDITDANGQNAVQMVFDLGRELVRPLLLGKLQSTTTAIDELVAKLTIAGCNLCHVAYTNDLDLMKCMLETGVNVDSRNHLERTALHAAVEIRDLGIAKWLIDNGADVNARDHEGYTALFLCSTLIRSHDAKVFLHLLLEHGADPNIGSFESGETLLFRVVACHLDDAAYASECMELLLHHDAIPLDTTVFHMTIFDYAMINGGPERVYPLVAQLARLRKKDAAIDVSVIRCNRKEYQAELVKLTEYYERCDAVLATVVFQQLTMFNLLTDSDSRVKTYMRHETFIATIEEIINKLELRKSFPCYYSRLRKRLNKAADLLKLENTTIPIICGFFDGNESEGYIPARIIVGYLNDCDLQRLSEV